MVSVVAVQQEGNASIVAGLSPEDSARVLEALAFVEPIYRGNQLVGAIGVSGDGIDQDDMISFLGVNNAGSAMAGAFGNAPVGIRADNIVVNIGTGVRLRFISCPFAPFLDSTDQNVCQGL